MLHDLVISAFVILIVISPKLVAVWIDRRGESRPAG